MLSDDVPLVISRQVLQTLCPDLQRLPSERDSSSWSGHAPGSSPSSSLALVVVTGQTHVMSKTGASYAVS